MFCQLREVANLNANTINAIQRFFVDNEPIKQKTVKKEPSFEGSPLLSPPDDQLLSHFREHRDNDGDDAAEEETEIYNWLLETTGEKSESDVSNEVDFQWMKACLISASCNLDVLVVAAIQKFVILQADHKVPSKLEPVSWVKVAVEDEDLAKPVYITSVLPLCIASTRSVESSSIDWTCICIGLSNGNINFYTERGICVFSEKCSHRPIRTLSFGPSIYPGNQELVALTADNKVIIFEGLSLFTVLKTARNQIAFGEKTLSEISDTLQLNCHSLEPDNLKGVSDCVNAGLVKPTSFDQYVTASLSPAGKNARVTRSSLPTYSNYFSCNKTKFASFLWHSAEISGTELLSDAIHHFTSQITNSMPSIGFRSFLRIGVSRKDRPVKAWAIDARSHRIPERSFIFDKERKGERCYLAPSGWPLVAVADNCARVLLLNSNTRRVLRIWKGYRQARCAWIESLSTSDMNQNRRLNNSKSKTLFLVIFAPKRGLLEIWSMQNGPRVSAFNVDEKGRLLTISTGQRATLLGSSEVKNLSSISSTTAAFLSSSGIIFTINVPFHLSALDTSVASVHDENMMKQFEFSSVLIPKQQDEPIECKGEVLNVDMWVSLCKKLKTWTIRRRFLEILIANCEVAIDEGDSDSLSCSIPLKDINAAMSILIEDINMKQVFEKNVADMNPFKRYLVHFNIILNIYTKLRQLYSLCEESKELPDIDYDALCSGLYLSSDEFEKFNFPLLRSNIPKTSVNQKTMSLREFLDQFEFLNDTSTFQHSSNKVSDKGRLKTDLDFHQLGAFIFGCFVYGDIDPNQHLDELLSKIDSPIIILCEIFVSFWLDMEWNIDPQRWALRSLPVFKILFSKCKTYNDYQSVIDLIENKVFNSVNVQAALFLCLQLRFLRMERVEECNSKTKRVKFEYEEKGQTINNELPNKSEELPSDSMDEEMSMHESNKINPDNGSRKRSSDNQLGECEEDNFLLIEDDDILYSYETSSTNISAKWFTLMIEHLYILALLQLLPTKRSSSNSVNTAVSRSQELNNGGLTLERLAHKGFGFYREQIGIWCAKLLPNSREIAFVLSNLEIPNADKDSSNCLSDNTISTLNKLCERLPISMRPELTLCDCCWECVSAWAKDESRHVTKLRMAIDFLHILQPAPRLQHGIASMIWTTFLKDPFQKLYTIINQQDTSSKILFASKDRILKRDVLVVESDLGEYVNCVRELLRALADSSAKLSGGNNPPFVEYAYETFIEQFFEHPKIERCKLSKTLTLCELAEKCKVVNYYLILHHIHLATSMCLLVNSGIRLRPSALFDSVGQMSFFTNLCSHPLIPLANVDDRTKARRQTFLENVVESISTSGIGCKNRNSTDSNSSQYFEYLSNWEFVLGLAKDWQLDIDALQIKEILMLYEFGFDQEAEKLITKVENKQLLLQELLPPIAARIKQFFDDDVKLFKKVFQCSAGTESSINYIKNVPDAFLPKIDELNVLAVRRLINKANSLARSKSVSQPSNASKHEKSVACGSAYKQQSSPLFDFSSKIKLLKEFDEIFVIVEKFHDMPFTYMRFLYVNIFLPRGMQSSVDNTKS